MPLLSVLCELGAPLFTEYLQAPDDTKSVSFGAFFVCLEIKVSERERRNRMVKINGEEKEIAGKNLLEFLKETGFEPERVVVERNLMIIPKDKLGNVTIQDEDVIEVLRFVGGG